METNPKQNSTGVLGYTSNVSIPEIKEKLGVKNLPFVVSTDEEGNLDPDWVRSWNQDTEKGIRTNVSMPTDVLNKIQSGVVKADEGVFILQDLGEKIAKNSGEPYHSYRIVLPATQPVAIL